MKSWKSIHKPINVEADILLSSDAPDEITEYYEHNENGNLAAWISDSGEQFGCIRLNRSVSVNSEKAKTIVLFVVKPAKGRGNVGISVANDKEEEIATLLYSTYSQASLDWLKSILPILSEFFNLEAKIEDRGMDA